MQAPLLAVEEIKRLSTDLHMPGIEIGSHIGDWNLDARELDPVWKVGPRLETYLSSHSECCLNHIYFTRYELCYELTSHVTDSIYWTDSITHSGKYRDTI